MLILFLKVNLLSQLKNFKKNIIISMQVVINQELDNEYVRVLIERNQFEQQLYDFLVSPMLLPQQDSSFWDPVVVNLDPPTLQQVSIETIKEPTECSICITDRTAFKRVKCCNQLICNECAVQWFNKSVYCPYCKQDLRELI